MSNPLSLRLPVVLRRRESTSPIEGFLLLGDGAEASALALLAALEREQAGSARLFKVAGGVLLTVGSDRVTRSSLPGSIRLRKLGPALFVPSDAEPSPTLLDGEVEGMTRDLGLVLLPGGKALAFDPNRPIALAEILRVDRRVTESTWEPPPEGPRLADRLLEVTLERLVDDPELFIDSSGNDIATEDPRPEDSGASRRLLGGAALGAGRGMIRLGQALGVKGLTGLGAKWASSAIRMAPRLGESILGKQETALRDLLREFREGNIERALRRALPMGKGAERGPSVAGSADLPDRPPRYSLSEILGASGSADGDQASYWLGGIDVRQALIREYHKAAREAARRGDSRRAAFIYAKLLEDYRLAANVLLQGGLARDAAWIYLEKLDDRPSAARAFEAAGEFDRAIELFRSVGDFERLGNLLTRLGEHEEALRAYVEAADRIEAEEGDYLKAGELLRARADRADLAAIRFENGWKARPWPNAIGCAVELARLFAREAQLARLRQLIDEADELLAPLGHESDAARFYNELAGLADQSPLPEARDELRDRALVALAGKLRQWSSTSGAAPGMVASLFGPARNWSAELIRDAEHALRGQGARPSVPDPSPPRPEPFRITKGPVTASALAEAAGLAFVGNQSGEVFRLDLETGQTSRVGRYGMPVVSLAVSKAGEALVVLWHDRETARTVIASYARRPDGSFEMTEGRIETNRSADHPPFLAPSISESADVVALWNGRHYVLLRGPSLTPWAEIPRESPHEDGGGSPPGAALLLPSMHGGDDATTLLELGPAGAWALLATEIGTIDRLKIPWAPVPRAARDYRPLPVLSWRFLDQYGVLTLLGVGEGGTLNQTALRLRDLEPVTSSNSSEVSYQASALIRFGLVAGVSEGIVSWFRVEGNRLVQRASTPIFSMSIMAAATVPRTGELVLISDDGRADRVAWPVSLRA